MTDYFFHLNMGDQNNSVYHKNIKERIIHIMDITGLELAGFAQLVQISESHLYALINGRRKLTGDTADKIGAKLKLKGWQILNLDYIVPDSLQQLPAVKKFYTDYKHNPEYFKKTKSSRKVSHFIEQELLSTKLFSTPVPVSTVREACAGLDKEYSSKQVSQTLNYLVETKKLKSKKTRQRRKNGTYGEREVYLYFAPGAESTEKTPDTDQQTAATTDDDTPEKD